LQLASATSASSIATDAQPRDLEARGVAEDRDRVLARDELIGGNLEVDRRPPRAELAVDVFVLVDLEADRAAVFAERAQLDRAGLHLRRGQRHEHRAALVDDARHRHVALALAQLPRALPAVDHVADAHVLREASGAGR
jgi:hypothetical protein